MHINQELVKRIRNWILIELESYKVSLMNLLITVQDHKKSSELVMI